MEKVLYENLLLKTISNFTYQGIKLFNLSEFNRFCRIYKWFYMYDILFLGFITKISFFISGPEMSPILMLSSKKKKKCFEPIKGKDYDAMRHTF